MGRRFTAASNEMIHCATTPTLAGFDYRYGTTAAWVNVVSYPGGFAAILCTNASSGACFNWGFDGTVMGCWDGGGMQHGSTPPSAGTTFLVGTSKATGSVPLRSHMYVPSTNTFTHADFGGVTGDSAAVTSLTLGANSTGDFADIELFEAAMWNKTVMADGAWERLARTRDWGRFAPDFHKRFTEKDEAPVDMSTSLGRFRVRQSSRTGTTRGTRRHPMGGSPPNRRR